MCFQRVNVTERVAIRTLSFVNIHSSPSGPPGRFSCYSSWNDLFCAVAVALHGVTVLAGFLFVCLFCFSLFDFVVGVSFVWGVGVVWGGGVGGFGRGGGPYCPSVVASMGKVFCICFLIF